MSKWKMVKFSEIIIDETKNAKKVKKTSYKMVGKYPIIDQGMNEVAGYTNQEEGVYKNTPAIIFGDHTRIIKYIDEPFFLGADGTKILNVQNKDLGHRYLYYVLKKKEVKNTGYNRHYKWLKDIKIPIPPLEIQIKIANELDTITNLIEKRKQQLDELDLLVKAKFMEMFGDPVENPMGWEVMELGKYIEINPPKIKYGIPDTTQVSFVPMRAVSEKGMVDTSGTEQLKDVVKGFTNFKVNDVLFAKITPCMENGKGGVVKTLVNDIGYGSTEFHVLRADKQVVNSQWLFQITHFYEFRKEAERKMSGSAGQKRVPAKFLSKYQCIIPPIILQNKFAEYVKAIEDIKQSIESSKSQLETLYKSKMQEYFG